MFEEICKLILVNEKMNNSNRKKKVLKCIEIFNENGNNNFQLDNSINEFDIQIITLENELFDIKNIGINFNPTNEFINKFYNKLI